MKGSLVTLKTWHQSMKPKYGLVLSSKAEEASRYTHDFLDGLRRDEFDQMIEYQRGQSLMVEVYWPHATRRTWHRMCDLVFLRLTG
tara:strand:- start:2970 stop:3227 length:258 start_codon:yes stop_codon:yes gene_type:complete